MVKAILVETNREEHGKIQDFYGSEGFPAWKVSFEHITGV
jgi:hypothetical protein